jgi:hypothetical protein
LLRIFDPLFFLGDPGDLGERLSSSSLRRRPPFNGVVHDIAAQRSAALGNKAFL